jgi:hypothetical protein
MMADAIQKFQARADGIGKWLKNTAPHVVDEQKHLDDGSVERAYWHYGYRAALLDAIRLLEGGIQ